MQVDFDKEIMQKTEEVLKNRTLDIKWVDCIEKKGNCYQLGFSDFVKSLVAKLKRYWENN